MSTRESGSSTQSTATSWMRIPRRWASTSSSVSKNQPWSSIWGSSWRAASARIALNPHWASENRARRHEAQQAVVGAGDELALGAAHHPGPGRQPGADRHLAVAGDQRRDQRQQRPQVGRQVDVHVAEHVGVAGRPGGAQRPPAALLVEAQDGRRGKLERQRPGDRQRRVGAGVVGDHDPPRVGQLGGQEGVQAADRALQRAPARCRPGRRCRSGSRAGPAGRDAVGWSDGAVMGVMVGLAGLGDSGRVMDAASTSR